MVRPVAQVELGASKSDAQAAVCCMLDPEMQPGAEDSTASAQKAAAHQSLALSAGTELQACALIEASPLSSSASSIHSRQRRIRHSVLNSGYHCARHLCSQCLAHLHSCH